MHLEQAQTAGAASRRKVVIPAGCLHLCCGQASIGSSGSSEAVSCLLTQGRGQLQHVLLCQVCMEPARPKVAIPENHSRPHSGLASGISS